jgi:hypothetical protein
MIKKVSLVFMFLFTISVIKAQSVESIVKKHIEKIGGKEAWNKVHSIKLKGELISANGSEEILSIDVVGKFIGYKKKQGKNMVQFAFDGETYWDLDFKSKKLVKRVQEMSFRNKKKAKEFPSIFIVAQKLGYKIELLGDENIMGKNCFKLKISKGITIVNGKKVEDESISFINKETYLEVLKVERYVRGSLDTMSYMYYNDYKKVEGILLPFTTNWFINDNQLSINVKSYVLNDKIDDSIFQF